LISTFPPVSTGLHRNQGIDHSGGSAYGQHRSGKPSVRVTLLFSAGINFVTMGMNYPQYLAFCS
jgi:hypothetical protein